MTRDSDVRHSKRSSWLIALAAIACGILMSVGPTGPALDRALAPLRFGIMHRAASGQVVIVEMDARSAAAIKRWPWSRTNYAQVVDRLRQGGAASIVFDVDFSSSSDLPGDSAFAAALARANGTVVLPTFGQTASSSDHRVIDALPIPLLRPHVALASVSIAPDADGQVRLMPLGTITAGTPRPSLSAFIAQRSGAADVQFPIDMSIDPGTIPRLSFIDVRNGKFDVTSVRGRNVLIGATAIEMGDRYGTPNWGVIPGVVVQAIAAETLLCGLPVDAGPAISLALAALCIALVVRMRTGLGMAVVTLTTQATVLGLVLVSQYWFLTSYPLAASLAAITLAGLLCGLREASARFRMQRMIDEETGLPNARSLQASGDVAREALVVASINNYESLLAILGAAQAAETIMRVADRLALVALDGRVFRTGERHLAFGLTLNESSDTLDGLRNVLLRPIEVGGRRVDVTMTLGVSAVCPGGIDRQLADATLAADQARHDGVFWQRSIADDGKLERSITMMGDLDAAISTGQIDVFYQPKYDLRANRIASVEALVRWPRPDGGYIAPDVFVPLAEDANRIAPLTLYVLRRVIRDLAEWRSQHDVAAAVNISAKLLSSASFNAEVEVILAEFEVPATALIFEVTESATMSDPESAIAALRRYRDLGIAVSMDDYGTGQSTLTYLRQLPLSELKIDRSFVQHAHDNRDDGVLVRSTIELAHQLGLKVVAEGVENGDCLNFLRQTGCDLAQGYFISRPVSKCALQDLLTTDNVLAA